MRAVHRVRLRFTLLYGLISVLSGMTLLAIVVVLARSLPPADVAAPSDAAPSDAAPPDAEPVVGAPAVYVDFRTDMLLVSGIALAVMAPVSLVLGWVFAGRMLRPVQSMTLRLRQISGSNVHERLAVGGPRDEFKDLADTIDGLLTRLESALNGHKRFVANAAHELRTPLTVESALIEEPLIDPDATVEAYRANFERLLAVNRQRGRLLESLLTLAGSEHVRDRVDKVDLAEVVQQAIRDRSASLDRHGLRVMAAARPAWLLGDPTLIARLVANLCDNAIHYNVPGGEIDVSTRLDTGRAVLVIANTGPVVPPEHVPRLFEPFQRLHRVSDDAHHGLGLSIVRAIVAAHSAELDAHARPEGGLVFEIAFPAVSD
ncbi:sensor histidine kinase [Cryptosporangium aurantiacum]|uniref:histidine kinase n=1 Tax=Cryptosporangium aurantiacum TaxID=134849 RepID=A0A1M7P8Q3_9ACTN|nr:HAMP domain-containing sensor histidine kinase [Cryptosporangium aurantiacum]SHN13048.1 Signal transduction histidine kinase [Cryptosporangium aurantiacum]